MNSLGIDPGRYGALACITPSRSVVAVLPMPLHSDDSIDWEPVALFLNAQQPAIITIEKVHSRPGQGVKATFTFGGMFEGLLAICQAMRLPYELVAPQTWQKDVLADMDREDTKAASIAYCARAFPGIVPVNRNGRGHDGVADALCLAEYGRRHFVRAGT